MHAAEQIADAPKAATATRAWKGFDLAFKCRGHQYAVGETYTINGAPKLCERGFHACASPLDVLRYYPAAESRFAEVELIGDVVRHDSDREDSKLAAASIRIVREVTYQALWRAHREWLAEQDAEARATGDSGHASATGFSGHASATGDSGHASATGKNAIAVAVGRNARARSANGWIVLAHYHHKTDALVAVKAAQLKPDTWYTIDHKTGEIVECKD